MTARQVVPHLTPEEVGELLRLSPRTVLKLARRDGLRCIRFGNKVRFSSDEVAAWLDARGRGR